jgi:glutathione S-transferase
MGEVPILEVDGRKLTQSAAILLYLSNKHGRLWWPG